MEQTQGDTSEIRGADLTGILDAVDLPIIVIGRDCSILRFNRAASTVLQLAASDIGRSPGDALPGITGLNAMYAHVIADGVPSRREIREGGTCFLLRVAPYQGPDQDVGAVLTFTNVTAFRASLDQALFEREYAKAILNTVIDPLVVLDADLRIQTANQAFYATFRYSRDQTQGVPFCDLGDNDWQAAELWKSLRAVLTEDATFQNIEVERELPMVGRRTLLIDARRLSRAGDATLLMTLRDITESKKAQQAILYRTAQFETLLNQAPLGVFLLSADFRIRQVNPTAMTAFGEVPGGVLGEDFADIMHLLWEGKYAEEVIGIFRHTLKTGESYITAGRGELRADRGITEYYEWRLDRIILPEGGFGLVCYFRDISDRKRAEINASLLASIVESSDDAIISKDLSGMILSWNRGAERLFGYRATEAVGRSITIIIPPDRLGEESKILERLKQGDRVDHFETVRVRKDGSCLNISLTISPVRDASGRIVGASKVARDITERVRQQEALRTVNAALQRANADLQQFAYSASHDLQEPLRTVAIYTELLQETFGDKLGPAGAEYIGFVIDGVKRLNDLLTGLRIYMQVSATNDEPADEIDAEEVLKKTLLNLEVAIQETGASISNSHLPRVRMQEFQLEQLFQNLISNAIHYRGGLPPQIQITAVRQGEEWIFSIQDNGIGIEPRFRQQIFEMFKRLHSAAERPGSGVGLAICRRIVERAGGRLWVESEPGQGSTFYFTVRCAGLAREESVTGRGFDTEVRLPGAFPPTAPVESDPSNGPQ